MVLVDCTLTETGLLDDFYREVTHSDSDRFRFRDRSWIHIILRDPFDMLQITISDKLTAEI